MGTYGLAASRRTFVLVTPENHIVARAARSEAALAAMLGELTYPPATQIVVEERLLRELPGTGRALVAHHVCIVPDGLVDALYTVASRHRRSPRTTAALLARVPSAGWFSCDIRRREPGSERQTQLF